MEKVIQSFQEKSNALLESPTGTGKTLCLLCATLAWRKSLGPFSTGPDVKMSLITGDKSGGPSSQSAKQGLPTIVYTSRTHSQTRQVIQELKRSSYRSVMLVLRSRINDSTLCLSYLLWTQKNYTILRWSREQLYIDKEVSVLCRRTQTKACHFLFRKRAKDTKHRCSHYSRGSETIYELKTEEPPEKLDLDQFLPKATAVGQDSPVKSSSSLLKARRGKISSLLGEVLPANRSSLTCCKDQFVSLKYSNDLFRNEKKLRICERETMQCQDSKVLGFPCTNEIQSEEQPITPCSTKKCKLEHGAEQHDNSKHSSLAKDAHTYGLFSTNNSMRSESSRRSDSGSAQNVQVGSTLLGTDKRIVQQGGAEFLSRQQCNIHQCALW